MGNDAVSNAVSSSVSSDEILARRIEQVNYINSFIDNLEKINNDLIRLAANLNSSAGDFRRRVISHTVDSCGLLPVGPLSEELKLRDKYTELRIKVEALCDNHYK